MQSIDLTEKYASGTSGKEELKCKNIIKRYINDYIWWY